MSNSSSPSHPNDDFLSVASSVCQAAAKGDLEPRITIMPQDPVQAELARNINSLLDTTDCFVRESAATLHAASEKRFHRRFMVRGLPGSFRRGAMEIGHASNEMAAQADALSHADAYRAEVFAQLDAAVLDSRARVATAVKEIEGILGGVTVVALNARIEASRAREEGFAVVAAEVEKMAQRITAATGRLTGEVERFMSDSRAILNSVVASDQEAA